MTQEEKKQIDYYLIEIFRRINLAKDHLKECNYGLALKTLSEAYPRLEIKVD